MRFVVVARSPRFSPSFYPPLIFRLLRFFFHIYQLFFFFLVRVLLRFNLYLPFGCVFSRFFISVFLIWFLLQNKMILLRFSFVSVDEVGKFGHYCYAKIRRKVTPIALDQEKEKESDIERVSENVLFIESLILHALFLISYRSRLRITFRMNKMRSRFARIYRIEKLHSHRPFNKLFCLPANTALLAHTQHKTVQGSIYGKIRMQEFSRQNNV